MLQRGCLTPQSQQHSCSVSHASCLEQQPWQHVSAISPLVPTAHPCIGCCLGPVMSPVLLCHTQRLPWSLTDASALHKPQLHCLTARSCPWRWLTNLHCARSAVHRVNNFKGSIYMVFDYMDHDLTGLMERHGGFTVPQVRFISEHMCTAAARHDFNSVRAAVAGVWPSGKTIS